MPRFLKWDVAKAYIQQNHRTLIDGKTCSIVSVTG